MATTVLQDSVLRRMSANLLSHLGAFIDLQSNDMHLPRLGVVIPMHQLHTGRWAVELASHCIGEFTLPPELMQRHGVSLEDFAAHGCHKSVARPGGPARSVNKGAAVGARRRSHPEEGGQNHLTTGVPEALSQASGPTRVRCLGLPTLNLLDASSARSLSPLENGFSQWRTSQASL